MLRKNLEKVQGLLPKQWRHWCKEAGLSPTCKDSRKQANWRELEGLGYIWSINDVGRFTCTKLRYATPQNCDIVSASYIPNTKKEFTAILKDHLRSQAKQLYFSGHHFRASYVLLTTSVARELGRAYVLKINRYRAGGSFEESKARRRLYSERSTSRYFAYLLGHQWSPGEERTFRRPADLYKGSTNGIC